jgi:hypothetical protein
VKEQTNIQKQFYLTDSEAKLVEEALGKQIPPIKVSHKARELMVKWAQSEKEKEANP